MGRNAKNKRKLKAKASNEATQETTKTVGKNGPKYSVEQLLEKASEAIDTFSYEVAQKFCQRALELEPDNVKALETSGQLLMDLGNVDGAKHCFGRAVELSPDRGHSKYMYLGQLFTGAEAIACFQKGIDLMMKERVEQQENEVAVAGASSRTTTETSVSARDISNAHCSVAELYMTDCCDDEGAEDCCRSSIENAVSIDPSNPEALQLYASFLLVKQDVEAARVKIKESVSLWLPRLKELDKPTSSGESDQNVDDLNPAELGYQTRIQTAQILIEVKEFDTACDVLESLLDENDEVVEVWHLLGWTHYQQGPDFYNNARHYINKAKQVLAKTGDDDNDMKAHLDELLDTIGPGPAEDPDEVTMEDEPADDVDDEADSSSDEDQDEIMVQ